MPEAKMPPWSFTIVFDEARARDNGYSVEGLYDAVDEIARGCGNVRCARDTWAASPDAEDGVMDQCVAMLKLAHQPWAVRNVKSWTFREWSGSVGYDYLEVLGRTLPELLAR